MAKKKKATRKAAAKKTTKKTTKKATKKAAKKTTKKATKKVAKKATKKAAKKTTKKAAKTTAKKKRKANPALLVALKPNAELAAIVGSSALPRGQVMKKIWTYVKGNKLQDPNNGQYINTDAKLKSLFKKGRIHMTEIGKVLKAPFLT